MKTKNIVIVLTIITFIIIGTYCLRYFSMSHAVPKEQLAKIDKGMTKDSVIKLIGNPLSQGEYEKNKTSFYYGGFRRFKWCTVDVYFEENKKVTGIFHDH